MSATKTNPKHDKHIPTASGASVYLDALDEAEIRMYDISYGLNNVVRWSGQFGRKTVADHSALVTYMAIQVAPHDNVLHKHALLHDATEAYLGELPSVVKAYLPAYSALERVLHRRIMHQFGVPELNGDMEFVLDALDTIASAVDLVVAGKFALQAGSETVIPTKRGDHVLATRSQKNDVVQAVITYLGITCKVPIGRTWTSRIPTFEFYATDLLGEYDYV